MNKNTEYFINEFDKKMKKNNRNKPGNIPYGSNVISILETYKNLSTFEERKSFREALERLLTDSEEKKRKFAVDICIGFLVFRDSI